MKQHAKSGTEKILLIKQNFCCYACNLPFSLTDIKEPREIHHILPLYLGGEYKIENLALVHGYCHDKLHSSCSKKH